MCHFRYFLCICEPGTTHWLWKNQFCSSTSCLCWCSCPLHWWTWFLGGINGIGDVCSHDSQPYATQKLRIWWYHNPGILKIDTHFLAFVGSKLPHIYWKCRLFRLQRCSWSMRWSTRHKKRSKLGCERSKKSKQLELHMSPSPIPVFCRVLWWYEDPMLAQNWVINNATSSAVRCYCVVWWFEILCCN